MLEKSQTTEQETPNTLKEMASRGKSSGPLVGVAIIVIVLIVGGFYFWKTKINVPAPTDQLPTIQSGGEADAVVNQLQTQGTSDEINAIEKDLNATDLNTIDSDLGSVLNQL